MVGDNLWVSSFCLCLVQLCFQTTNNDAISSKDYLIPISDSTMLKGGVKSGICRGRCACTIFSQVLSSGNLDAIQQYSISSLFLYSKPVTFLLCKI